jgi:predicted lactoylglutathione lyase
MKTNIFVNLTTKDLERAKNFFTGLGFTINPQFTDENAACIVISDNIFAMIVVEDFFKRFTKKEIVNDHVATETATCLSAESKEKVDEFVTKALSMGATENIVPDMQANESMYGRSINDLDGHIWEIMWMDPKTIK